MSENFKYFCLSLFMMSAAAALYFLIPKPIKIEAPLHDVQLKLEKGSDVWEFNGQSDDLDMVLRVFNYNQNEYAAQRGVLSIATHVFVATPLRIGENVFDKELASEQAVNEAETIFVYAQDSSSRETLDRIVRIGSANALPCAQIKGNFLRLERFMSGGIMNKTFVKRGSDSRYDFKKLLLVKDFEDIQCP